MRLNRKGYMLVEIIIAFSIAMAISLYLINLTNKFKETNEDIYQSALYLKDKISITKNVMNDLKKGKIVSFNVDENNKNSTKNKIVDFEFQVSDGTMEFRRIQTKEVDGKFVFYYGKFNGNFDTSDVSYYEKELEDSLVVGDINIDTDSKNHLGITIPLSSIYSNDNYDIFLLLEKDAKPVLQQIPKNNYKEKLWKYKEKITKIIFEDSLSPKAGAESYDISSLGNGTVMAHVIPAGNDTYIAYIQGDKKIYTNADSSKLFAYFERLETIENIELLDTSLTSNMRLMFSGCNNLKSIDVSHFDTSKVTDMYNMFNGLKKLENLDLSHFDTSNVTDMSYMFQGDENLISLNISNFNTSNVTNMSRMFNVLSKLESLNISSFDTSKVVNMSGMFADCSELNTITFGNKFDTSNVTNMNYMFGNLFKLRELDVSKFNTSNVTDMGNMFSGLSLVSVLDVSKFNTSKVTNMSSMFRHCFGVNELNVRGFNTSKVTDMGDMFNGCKSITSLDVSNFNTSKVTNMSGMFAYLPKITTLDIRNFNTSNVTNMGGWISSISSSNVTGAGEGMFQGCTLLREIKFGTNFNTSKVVNMNLMFASDSSLETLNLGTFDTSNVTDMRGMFYRMGNIKNINVSNKWSTENILYSNFMFYGDSKLPNYNSSMVDHTKAHYNTGGYLKRA